MIKQLRRNNRLEAMAEIRRQMDFHEGAPLRMKMDALEAFHLEHPEYAVRLLADTCGIKPATLDHHFRLNKREKTQSALRRAELTPMIAEIIRADGHHPGAKTVTAELNRRGHTCSHWLVLDIMKDLGLDNSWDTRFMVSLDKALTKCAHR